MKKDECISIIKKHRLIPVVVIDDVSNAIKLAESLVAGGLPIMEITFRTEAAAEAIRLIHMKVPEMLLLAGTVLTKDQLDRALEYGASGGIAPGLDVDLVQYAIQKNTLFVPGVYTPSELNTARNLGLKTVKFFPAEIAGGVKMLKALLGPFGDMTFVPTGGIDGNNVRSYLENDHVLAVGGSWMVDKKLIKEKNFAKITELVQEAIKITKEVNNG